MKQTIIIIFGITGDLARRQLLPALYHLITGDPENQYAIIGVAQHVSDVAALWATAQPFMGTFDEVGFTNGNLAIPGAANLTGSTVGEILNAAIEFMNQQNALPNKL